MRRKLPLLFGVYLSRPRVLTQGFCDLGWEKHYSIFIFTNLSLKMQISFNDKCRQGNTLVALGVPVTLSPVKIKDAFISYCIVTDIWNTVCAHQYFQLGVVIRPSGRSGYLMDYLRSTYHSSCNYQSMLLINFYAFYFMHFRTFFWGGVQRAERVHGRKRLRTPIVYIIPCNYKKKNSQHLSSHYVGERDQGKP